MARTTRAGLVGTVLAVDFHRNGVAGAGFFVVVFRSPIEPGAAFLATVFGTPGHVAVMRLSAGADARKPGLADDADRALYDHFRGDEFEAELRVVIETENQRANEAAAERARSTR